MKTIKARTSAEEMEMETTSSGLWPYLEYLTQNCGKKRATSSSAGSESEAALCHKQIAPPGKQSPDSVKTFVPFAACHSPPLSIGNGFSQMKY